MCQPLRVIAGIEIQVRPLEQRNRDILSLEQWEGGGQTCTQPRTQLLWLLLTTLWKAGSSLTPRHLPCAGLLAPGDIKWQTLPIGEQCHAPIPVLQQQRICSVTLPSRRGFGSHCGSLGIQTAAAAPHMSTGRLPPQCVHISPPLSSPPLLFLPLPSSLHFSPLLLSPPLFPPSFLSSPLFPPLHPFSYLFSSKPVLSAASYFSSRCQQCPHDSSWSLISHSSSHCMGSGLSSPLQIQDPA